jgi:hypothetical protein
VQGGIGTLARVQSAEPSAGFGSQELKLLATAMDAVIPPSDRMPSASAAGGVAYLRQLGWQYESIFEDLRRFLRVLQQESQKEFSSEFAALEARRQVAVMKSIEKSSAKLFSDFVGYVYEAYYTRPRVQGLLSCSILAVPDDNDDLLLTPVRELKGLYRECHEQ